MLELIQRIYRMLGIAVVMSSHILEDIERICDYVVIIDQGRLVVAQPLTGMGQPEGDLIVRIEGDREAFIRKMGALGFTVSRPSQMELQSVDDLVVANTGDAIYDAVRDTAAEIGAGLRSMRIKGRTLEDVYLGNLGISEDQQ
jgi:ABC-2 type transport system ATP-binding protein